MEPERPNLVLSATTTERRGPLTGDAAQHGLVLAEIHEAALDMDRADGDDGEIEAMPLEGRHRLGSVSGLIVGTQLAAEEMHIGLGNAGRNARPPRRNW